MGMAVLHETLRLPALQNIHLEESLPPIMRYLIAIVALAALSGCLDQDLLAEGASPIEAETLRILPENFNATGSFSGSADPLNIAGAGVCTSPSAECYNFDFTVASGNFTVDMVAALTWGNAVNDLDMYLFMDGQEISNDGINFVGDAPTNSQTMNVPGLAGGDYSLVVVGWSSGPENFNLEVTFA